MQYRIQKIHSILSIIRAIIGQQVFFSSVLEFSISKLFASGKTIPSVSTQLDDDRSIRKFSIEETISRTCNKRCLNKYFVEFKFERTLDGIPPRKLYVMMRVQLDTNITSVKFNKLVKNLTRKKIE